MLLKDSLGRTITPKTILAEGCYDLEVTDAGEMPVWKAPEPEFKESLAELYSSDFGEWLHSVEGCHVRPREGMSKLQDQHHHHIKTNRP